MQTLEKRLDEEGLLGTVPEEIEKVEESSLFILVFYAISSGTLPKRPSSSNLFSSVCMLFLFKLLNPRNYHCCQASYYRD